MFFWFSLVFLGMFYLSFGLYMGDFWPLFGSTATPSA